MGRKGVALFDFEGTEKLVLDANGKALGTFAGIQLSFSGVSMPTCVRCRAANETFLFYSNSPSPNAATKAYHLTVAGATTGTIQFTYDGQSTPASGAGSLSFDATGPEIELALEALSNLNYLDVAVDGNDIHIKPNMLTSDTDKLSVTNLTDGTVTLTVDNDYESHLIYEGYRISGFDAKVVEGDIDHAWTLGYGAPGPFWECVFTGKFCGPKADWAEYGKAIAPETISTGYGLRRFVREVDDNTSLDGPANCDGALWFACTLEFKAGWDFKTKKFRVAAWLTNERTVDDITYWGVFNTSQPARKYVFLGELDACGIGFPDPGVTFPNLISAGSGCHTLSPEWATWLGLWPLEDLSAGKVVGAIGSGGVGGAIFKCVGTSQSADPDCPAACIDPGLCPTGSHWVEVFVSKAPCGSTDWSTPVPMASMTEDGTGILCGMLPDVVDDWVFQPGKQHSEDEGSYCVATYYKDRGAATEEKPAPSAPPTAPTALCPCKCYELWSRSICCTDEEPEWSDWGEPTQFFGDLEEIGLEVGSNVTYDEETQCFTETYVVDRGDAGDAEDCPAIGDPPVAGQPFVVCPGEAHCYMNWVSHANFGTSVWDTPANNGVPECFVGTPPFPVGSWITDAPDETGCNKNIYTDLGPSSDPLCETTEGCPSPPYDVPSAPGDACVAP